MREWEKDTLHINTPHTKTKMKLARVSVKISDTTTFLVHPRILPTPPFLWEKFEPPFWENFKNLNLPLQLCWELRCLLAFPLYYSIKYLVYSLVLRASFLYYISTFNILVQNVIIKTEKDVYGRKNLNSFFPSRFEVVFEN